MLPTYSLRLRLRSQAADAFLPTTIICSWLFYSFGELGCFSGFWEYIIIKGAEIGIKELWLTAKNKANPKGAGFTGNNTVQQTGILNTIN